MKVANYNPKGSDPLVIYEPKLTFDHKICRFQ